MKVLDRGLVFDASTAPPHARFCTFTSLVHLGDGRLVAGFRTGSAKDSADEDIMLMVSEDEGATWSPSFTGFKGYPQGSGGRLRSVGSAEVEAGRLMASFLWTDRSDPTLPLASPETQGILPTKIYVAESTDVGHNWSPLRAVDLHPHKGNATTGDLMVLRNGSLALPYEAWKEYEDTSPGEHHAALRISDDGGQTWTGPVIVAHDDENRLLFWDQRLTVLPQDGRLLALFWTHDRQAGQDVPIHIAWGSADGRHWSKPESTGIAGQIASPLGLPDGRLFMAYVHRHDPPSLRALLSEDGGRSWHDELIFFEKRRGAESGMAGRRDFGDYWADMSIWTFGHPAAVLLPGGDVMVAHYAGDEQAMSIHWVRIGV